MKNGGNGTLSTGCPLCRSEDCTLWCVENSLTVVRCGACGLLFLTPIPSTEELNKSVTSGLQVVEAKVVNVRSRPSRKKVSYYAQVFRDMFPEINANDGKRLWIDIGCGYGEAMEAVHTISHGRVKVTGIEPMEHKAIYAKGRGLDVHNRFLGPSQFEADYVSAIDIFSHIPDFREFLRIVCGNMKTGGEMFLETGNLADLSSRSEFPNELGLPDHLVFAGESQIRRYLEEAGFRVVRIHRVRMDGFLNFFKNVVKKIMGRSAVLTLPYTSKYRQIQIRAQLLTRL